VPGKYKLRFSSPYIKEKTFENIEAPAEGLQVELEAFEKFVLGGTVVNSRTGEPIQLFRARIKQVQSFSGGPISQPAGHWQDINNAEGKFNIEALGAGVYQVQIVAEGFAWAWSQEIDTSRNAGVVVKLVTGGSIKAASSMRKASRSTASKLYLCLKRQKRHLIPTCQFRNRTWLLR